MKTKVLSVVFSIIFLFIIYMKPNVSEAPYTIEAKKISFSTFFVEVTGVLRVNGVVAPILKRMYIPLSSITRIEEV